MNNEKKKKTWTELREEVRNVRRLVWGLSYRLPHTFSIVMKENGIRVYFMSSPPNSKDSCMYYIDVPNSAPAFPQSSPPAVLYPWNQLFSPGFMTLGRGVLSKEEELLMERKRMTPTGISSYQLHLPSNYFLFNFSTLLYAYIHEDTPSFDLVNPRLIEPSISGGGARLNPEMCPANRNLIAYVVDGDLYVVNENTMQEAQLTFIGSGPLERNGNKSGLSAGYPSYVIQEEFNRFHGFWWCPSSLGGNVPIFRILYEEVDESEVDIVTLVSVNGSEGEDYRFPVAGSKNSKSTLRIIQFTLTDGIIGNIEIINFPHNLETYFTWSEYLVRAGWTPDGNFVWAQFLDRSQERLELVLIPPPPVTPTPDLTTKPPYVIYSEVASTNTWINVHDILEYFPYNIGDDYIEFIWASEETGFRHLYKIKSSLSRCVSFDSSVVNPPIRLSPVIEEKLQLTSGKWEVLNSPISVDFDRGLIYFLGLMNSPLERHLYVTSLRNPSFINSSQRLTSLGSSHTPYVSPSTSHVVITSSNITTPPQCSLFRISYNYADPSIHTDVRLVPITYLHVPSAPPQTEVPPPLVETHELQDSRETIYAMIHRPINFDSSKKYPTILYVYGGPEVQLVYNCYKGFGQLWLHLLASQGYVVISIDSRGSNHRGVKFESHIKGRLGTVELEDQVEVLNALIDKLGYIDHNRIAVYGWSYGGYLSLMAISHYSYMFKLAIAGAPVTSWELYDTGYTERYLGLPKSNPLAYQKGSVLSYIHIFPEDEDRLLIIHGLVDENVHFTHTAQLISALVKAGKPYTLQIYPKERHSLRRLEASEHYETALLSFLHRNL